MHLKRVGILQNKLKQKIIIFIFLILSISSLSGADKDNEKEFIVSNNGNFLFYNSPLVAESDTNTYTTPISQDNFSKILIRS